jgi:hypothetical protein
MNKKLLKALLCGVAVLSVSVFSSCKTDLSDIDSRLKVLETAWSDLKTQLGDAVVNGLYITSHGQASGGETYDITFSDGKTVKIPLVDGGGTEVTVEIANGVATITIDGVPYQIPLGPAVSSLVYRPEFADGYVLLGNEGANVKFLATPAVSADAVAAATVKIADVYQLGTRAGDQVLMSVVGGKATLEGEYINVPIKALEVSAGALYSVSIQMVVSGTTISSNYFPVRIADDYAAKPEELDPSIVPASKYNPVLNEDNSYTITVDGLELLGALNVKSFYGDTAPAGATFAVAPAGKQPEGDAQAKRDMLAASLASDGTWAFVERPGTNFGSTGFQIEVLVNDEVKARTNVTIHDAIAAMPAEDWKGGILNDLQAEWGGREKSLPMGASTIDFPASFFSYTPEGEGGDYDYTIIHGDRTGFFGKWPEFAVGDLIYNNGQKLVLADKGAAWAAKSRGIYWFCRGLAIVAPEPLATTDGKYVDELGRATSGGEIVPNADWWGPMGEGPEYATGGMMSQGIEIGLALSADGVLSLPASYTGYGLRLGIGACYEYAYGCKRLGVGDQFGLFFFNRRMAPEGATMPPAR